MMARPSSLAASTGSTCVPVGQRAGQVAELAVHPGRDHPGACGGRLHGGGVKNLERLAGGRARIHRMLASGEGDMQLMGRHGRLPGEIGVRA